MRRFGSKRSTVISMGKGRDVRPILPHTTGLDHIGIYDGISLWDDDPPNDDPGRRRPARPRGPFRPPNADNQDRRHHGRARGMARGEYGDDGPAVPRGRPESERAALARRPLNHSSRGRPPADRAASEAALTGGGDPPRR